MEPNEKHRRETKAEADRREQAGIKRSRARAQEIIREAQREEMIRRGYRV